MVKDYKVLHGAGSSGLAALCPWNVCLKTEAKPSTQPNAALHAQLSSWENENGTRQMLATFFIAQLEGACSYEGGITI